LDNKSRTYEFISWFILNDVYLLSGILSRALIRHHNAIVNNKKKEVIIQEGMENLIREPDGTENYLIKMILQPLLTGLFYIVIGFILFVVIIVGYYGVALFIRLKYGYY
jgi:uncharacterized membrane protein